MGVAVVAAVVAVSASATLAATPSRGRLWGVVPDVNGTGVSPQMARAHAGTASDEGNLPYDGGPVLHSNRTHVIFWQPQGSGLTFEAGYQALVGTFLADVAADSHSPNNVYGLTGQYRDGLGPAVYSSRYAGGVLDTDPLPPSRCAEPPVTGPGWTVCLTDEQLQTEIEHVVAADHLPTTETDVYFLVTPNGLGNCTDTTSSACALGGSINGYCAYHSQTPDGQIVYGVIPYNAVPGHCQSGNPRPNSNPADPTISSLSHEHSEMITDPVGDAWIDSAGNEDGDRCITSFGSPIGGSGQTAWNEVIHGGHFFLQDEWSNEDRGCEARDEADSAWFTTRRPQAGAALQLTGHGRDPDGRIVGYAWFFADGTVGHGRSPRHAFKHAGIAKVTLRTTDSAGNWAFYARTIPVSAAREEASRGRVRTKSG